MACKITVNGKEITGFNCEIQSSHAMIGETLSADRLSFEVSTEDEPFIAADQDHPLFTADDGLYFVQSSLDVSSLEDGDEIICNDGEALLGKFYFGEVKQAGENRYKITALSVIGKLLNSKHYGGIYAQTPAAQIFESILDGVEYTVDSAVAAATVTGYLPIATRRDNLQQLLLHTGATIKIPVSGAVIIEPMSNVSTGVFDAARCFGAGAITTTQPVSGVKLTEHNYSPAGNIVTLYNDGMDGAETIEFSEPYHSLAISGGTIVESGANYAKISGNGTVVLTGKPYTHVTRIVTSGNSNGDNVKSITDCYLASPQVAQSMADRFMSYYSCNQTIQQDVLVGTERAGDVVSVINPNTGDLETATISKLSVNVSTINRATAEFLVNFKPQGVISGFTNYVVLSDRTGRWTVPAGVTKIRLIAVGAGDGGGGGARGTAGKDSNEGTPGTGGSGGSGGKAGAGGKVFEITLNVTPGETFSYSCGIGGKAGTGETASKSRSDGGAGTPTVFGVHTSESGRRYPYGYFEAKTGETLAVAGADGHNGGSGGSGTNDDDGYGENGGSVDTYSGGRGGPYVTKHVSERNAYYYDGGGGGGAAYGKAGKDARSWTSKSSGGGAGATGIAGLFGINLGYGSGGGGGNGGGGGGGGGTAYHWNPTFGDSWMTGYGADPGDGTDGGEGADGVIIIYY